MRVEPRIGGRASTTTVGLAAAIVANVVRINNRGPVVGSASDTSKPRGRVCEMHGVIGTPKKEG